jgi:hypothetical protein
MKNQHLGLCGEDCDCEGYLCMNEDFPPKKPSYLIETSLSTDLVIAACIVLWFGALFFGSN